MSSDIDTTFREWLEQLAGESDLPVPLVAQHIGRNEVQSRHDFYPPLAAVLNERPLSIKELAMAAAKCWALGHTQDQTRLSQFAKASGSGDLVESLIDRFPENDEAAAQRIDTFVTNAIDHGYHHPTENSRFFASAALLASVILTSLHPKRFVDFTHDRWKVVATRLKQEPPSPGSKDYGSRMIWAGRFASQIANTPTYKKYWKTGEPHWTIAGVSWDFIKQFGLNDFLDDLAKRDGVTRNEGRERWRLHKYRERDPSLGGEAKARRKASDPLLHCDTCGFSFVERFGDLGEGFIEAHHTKPVKNLDVRGEEVSVDDFDLVCANCHRMIHRPKEPLSVEELKARLRSCETE